MGTWCVSFFYLSEFLNCTLTLITILQRGSFQLQLKSSGRCLTAEGGGTYMDQWDCLGTAAAPHQSWAIERVGTGAGGISFLSFFLLENLNSPGNCLRYKDASASSYALELVICNAFDPSQQIATSTTVRVFFCLVTEV